MLLGRRVPLDPLDPSEIQVRPKHAIRTLKVRLRHRLTLLDDSISELQHLLCNKHQSPLRDGVVEKDPEFRRYELEVPRHFALDAIRGELFHAEALDSVALLTGAEESGPRERVSG